MEHQAGFGHKPLAFNVAIAVVFFNCIAGLTSLELRLPRTILKFLGGVAMAPLPKAKVTLGFWTKPR